MAEEIELDARPYFQILHTMLRDGVASEELERVGKTQEWLERNSRALEKVCTKSEWGVIGCVWEHWNKFKNAPNRESLEQLVRQRDKSQPKIDVLLEYDAHVEDLKHADHIEMDLILEQRVKDYEKYQFAKALRTTEDILVGSVPNPKDKNAPPRSGTRDAIHYINDKLQDGTILIGETRTEGGLLSQHADTFKQEYLATKKARQTGSLFIPTGLPLIDNHLGGLRRKEVVGVLGYTGQRKSAVVRTIAYNAACCGIKVLHIPFESDFKEERAFYYTMHAHGRSQKDNQKIFLENDLSKSGVEMGALTDPQEKFLFETVVPHFAQTAGLNIRVREPGSNAWSDVKALIDRENRIEQVDLVILDYLTLMNTPGARDEKADKTAIVQDVKQMAMYSNEGRGMCFLTPVQGSRKGFEEASNNDGTWETSGIYMYSELDKSMDTCFYVFLNDELSTSNQMKLGSCKTRRQANIPSTFVTMNPHVGMITATGPGGSTHDVAARKETNVAAAGAAAGATVVQAGETADTAPKKRVRLVNGFLPSRKEK